MSFRLFPSGLAKEAVSGLQRICEDCLFLMLDTWLVASSLGINWEINQQFVRLGLARN